MNRDPFFNPPTNIDFTHEDPERGLAIGVTRGGMPPSADPADAPSGLTVNIDPYHDQLGRFTTGPGLGGRGGLYPQVTEFPFGTPASTTPGTPASTPSGTGKTAIQIVLSSFPVDTNRTYTEKAIPGGIILTHYGPGKKKHGWDPVHDSNSDIGKGNHENKLNPFSLSISDDLAHPAGLKLGGPVYLNGRYIGNYDDTAPEDGRVDIYDHDNIAGTNWGGVLMGGKLSSKP